MKRFNAKRKSSIALEALRGEKTSSIASTHKIHPNQIKREKNNKDKDRIIDELLKEIGQREMEIFWLKKNSKLSYHDRLDMIDTTSDISINRQTELLNVSKSSIYYNPSLNEKTIETMNAIDEIYTEFPYFGHRRIRKILDTEHGIIIGKKKTRSLMEKMGLEAIYPKKHPNTSKSNSFYRKFPYLLKNLTVNRPNHVWGTDITYIRMEHGFIYLSAIIDWYSRYVVAWNLSETLESAFCVKTFNEALKIGVPEIHNSDQGVQYTSNDYIAVFEKIGSIKISMDGRGRCFDNIFTERLWRSVKQENIYLNNYNNIGEVQIGLTKYFRDYNERRPHQSLNYKTPVDLYFENNNTKVFNKSKINTFTPVIVV